MITGWKRVALIPLLAVLLCAAGIAGAGAQTQTVRAEAKQDVAGAPEQAGGQSETGRTELLRRPVFSAAGVLESGGRSIRMAGVMATVFEAQCGSAPEVWPCGRVARTALQGLVRGRSIECRSLESEPWVEAVAHCKVGGRDIGEWLVSQGWAEAEGTEYAAAEKTARDEKRGIWNPARPGLAPIAVSLDGTPVGDAPVRVEVELSTQSLTVFHRGRIVGEWPVSTAREGKETPTGVWVAQWLSRNHRSKLYGNAPMPYSIFYDGDFAIHGTNQTGRLGQPASHGCVRLHPAHAAKLFDLVRREGVANTLVVIRW